jgi:tetratricopeptide (TPR) repeat protein
MIMLSIFAPTKYHAAIQSFIDTEERLGELIRLVDYLEERPVQEAHNLLVKEEAVVPLLDWYNLQPPFILPENMDLNQSNLLGFIFAKLNNFEKAYAHLSSANPTFFKELDFMNRMQQGISIDPEELLSDYNPFGEYRLMHNHAIIRHYAAGDRHFEVDKIKYFYLEAMQSAPEEEYRAFTGRHFALFLLDLGETEDALRVLKAVQRPGLSKEAQTALQHTLCQIWMGQLTVPYDQDLLGKLKDQLWQVLQVYQEQGRKVDEALVLTDAGIIANYAESWSESLGYFSQAIAIFEQEELPLLAANAFFRKGTLLYTWAQNGNPQFYRPAAESYQQALKVFKRTEVPEVYAEIQHHLGIIYAEMPDDDKKKSIWAAISSSAFQESLTIYTPTHHPYEYASVCNHYGNALLKYPQAKLTDNTEKALFYYQEALKVRTAEAYPMERCLTLLNYLEAQWNLGMTEDQLEEERYQAMLNAANEVLALSPSEELQGMAKQQLEKLAFLKKSYA